jgi:hypothetical protein
MFDKAPFCFQRHNLLANGRCNASKSSPKLLSNAANCYKWDLAKCVDSSCTTAAPHPVRNFSPSSPLLPRSMPSWRRPRRYSERWNKRQKAENYWKRNLKARALKVKERGAMTVGAHRDRLHAVPPANSCCREPIQSALRMA